MLDATVHRIHSIPDSRGAEWILLSRGSWTAARDVGEALASRVAPSSEAVHVVGNHGRWVVQCPDCGGAQLAAPDDPRFMCVECANIWIDGLWRPVVWPKEWQKIGALLDDRDRPQDRNYEVGETIADLREQNAALDAGYDPDTGVRFVPGADTDEDVPGAASDWEGHAHRWPKNVKPDRVYACPDCDLELTGLILQMDRAK